MAEITAALVKDLREKTGAGMMDCKRALSETAGDLEGAVDWLRKKGLSQAAKKAGRVAAEGLVGAAPSGNAGALVEVKAAPFPGGSRNAGDELTQLIATIGENMNLRRAVRLTVSPGVVVAYMHNALAPNLGKIGVLVAVQSTADAGKLAEFARKLALHVAAANPQYLDIASVDAKALDRERDILREQAKASGKADAIIDKMVEGRLKKFYEETVLTEQIFVIDGESRMTKVMEQAAKELGAPVKVTGFARFAL